MRTDLTARTAEPADARASPSFSWPEGTRGRHDQRLRLVSPEPSGRAGEQNRVSPTSSFFICHTLRCGSTLLSDALSSTDLAGYPEEYFPERYPDGRAYVATVAALKDPDTWQADWNRTPLEECLDRVRRSGTSPNGVFAAKLKWCNIPYLGEVLGARAGADGPALSESLGRRFPHLRYVWVTRRDKVRQAVSLVKARQSAQWKALSAPELRSGPLDYNFLVVDRALRRIVEEECAWEQYFISAGMTPLTVVYEDLVRNYESTVRGLLKDLEIALPAEYAFPVPRLHKQADAVSEEWVERYRQDARASQTRRTVANLPALLTKPHLRETYVMPRLRRSIERVRASGQKLI